MQIGIFGGSFDPVTRAHLIVAAAAAEALELDQVRFIPTAIQPWKPDGPDASAADRVAMLEAATADEPRFVVDEREIARGGISYTVDTLEDLRREMADDALFLLLGADAVREFARWRRSDRICELASVVAMSRAGESPPDVPGVSHSITVPSVAIAASSVRDAIRAGEAIDGLVSEPVAAYIHAHRLYTLGT